MADYAAFYQRSLQDPDAFWREEAARIDWQKSPTRICDASRPPFVRWFPDGTTNLCHNAVDRHLPERADQPALIWVSSETGEEKTYTYAELDREVQRMAAIFFDLGVGLGDRVLIYLPMIPEAAFAMLACARIGAIHCVVFGGFASGSLASRIDDARPTLVVSADAGSRGGKVIPYKPLLDGALAQAQHKPHAVLLVDRGLAPAARVAGRDHDYTSLRERHAQAEVLCAWVPATHPGYVLYTSGTTGKPKGVQRDTGGYAVALAASMAHVFAGKPGDTFFCASDIGWVVGHSYILYGPLLAGMATVMYEGLPIQPDAGVWWRLVERHRVNVMFTSPTAIRILKRHDLAHLKASDLSSLRTLFLAGEPLDEPTAAWVAESLGVPVTDNYWQTETGWPILTLARGVQPDQPAKLGSPGVPLYGYRVGLFDDVTGEPLTEPGRKGVLGIEGPLPPGCLQTLWGNDARFVSTYWQSIPGRQVYSTFDWATRDADGYYTILGRTDDVLNVAGHRLGSREIEEAITGHPGVAEAAVVGVADADKGQVAVAFVVPRAAGPLEDATQGEALTAEILARVAADLGPVARPARVVLVPVLPKTRSGKLLRRAIQAVCEGRDPGDLSTMEDAAALQHIRP
ncbi:propionate--CoA ligase [Achromobacter sp. GG226]|uniref:propionate--CoA ligase n=1 Tax=Verticiella alkaliphila TaxID=2779529 RepID=UPI001C0B0F8E|nr:propionate--CoA ligase [Verticiella sp. GG226]MBU4611872.1 propionate--CoA ligase [Verticiella sp. GG226]